MCLPLISDAVLGPLMEFLFGYTNHHRKIAKVPGAVPEIFLWEKEVWIEFLSSCDVHGRNRYISYKKDGWRCLLSANLRGMVIMHSKLYDAYVIAS